MDYGAITIDTSVFDQKGLKLESGILKTLEQFKGKPSYLILSEIIVKEVHAHLKKKASDSRTQLKKAIRESRLNLSGSEEDFDQASNKLIPKQDDNEIATNRINSFVENTGAEVIPATGRVELDEIIRRYFQSEAPFAESRKKKSEFPDAIALLSLESWAKENNVRILAVTTDDDWEKFAEQSNHVDVVKDLAAAISQFQPHTAAIEFCMYISSKLPDNEPKDIYEAIHYYLSTSVSELDLFPEASSFFSWESDNVEVVFEEFQFVTDQDGNALLQPVQGQNEMLIVEAKVIIDATAYGTFSLSVRDPIDKDYVTIGGASPNTDFQFESEVLLTFEGNFEGENGEVELTGFELLSYPDSVDFGEIEPD